MSGPHSAQIRSANGDPGAITSSPAAQVVHALQVSWFGVPVNVPSAQGAQARSLVEVPGVAAYAPGSHSVHATQELALAIVE